MKEKIASIRGMNDILPAKGKKWQWLETQLQQVLHQYGYQEIRLPLVEKTKLYKRSVGESSDIVGKEMYSMVDQSGDEISLRPEGTAGCVRAVIEHDLTYQGVQRLWYYGPMFRHERPQKGRYRQFTQLGVEAYGMEKEAADVELIAISARLWKILNISDKVQLEINTLGDENSRAAWRQALVDYFNKNYDGLDEDSKKRLELNPLRILDSKNPALQNLISHAPTIMDYLTAEEISRWQKILNLLQELNIPYQINPRLVRGLDYYVGLVFEWKTELLGAQNTICAGGRYDKLLEMLGGRETPACGFAVGIERLLELVEFSADVKKDNVYVISASENYYAYVLGLVEKLRDHLPQFDFLVDLQGGSIKSQFKRADKSQARYAIIVGEEEFSQSKIALKDLRQMAEQKLLTLDECVGFLRSYEILN